MAYIVDRVVICDAFREPDKHYQLLTGGRSKLVPERRPSMRFLALLHSRWMYTLGRMETFLHRFLGETVPPISRR